MYEFKINLLSNDPKDSDKNQAILNHQTANILRDLKKRSKKDLFIKKLKINIYTNKFWAIWTNIDGSLKDSDEQIFEKQRLALKKLSKTEIQQIMKITMNKAFLGLNDVPEIRNYLGHTIFFNEIYNKENSLFSNLKTEDMRHRLINGMFWENLGLTYRDQDFENPYNSKKIIDNIMLQNQNDLNLEFSIRGYNLLEKILKNRRKNRKDKSSFPEIDLDELNQTTQERYINFVEELYNNKDLFFEENDIGILMSSYLEEKIKYLGDYEPEYKNPFDTKPFINEIIKSSEIIKRNIGQLLRKEMKQITIGGPRFKIIKELPCNTEIINYALNFTDAKIKKADYQNETIKNIKIENIKSKQFKSYEIN